MNCRHAENLIQTALDGRLVSADRSGLDAHLAACSACRTAWDDYRALSRRADTWTQHALDVDDPGFAFTDRVIAQITSSDSSQRAHFPWQPFACSALTVLALVAASFLISPIIPSVHPTTSVAALLPLRDLISTSHWWQPMSSVPRDVLGAWGSFTSATFHLSNWVWDTLALSFGINVLFIWWMRRKPWEIASR